MFRAFLCAVWFSAAFASTGAAALLSVTLEPSPHLFTGPNFAILESEATIPENKEYAPLLDPAKSQYAFSSTPTMFVDAYNPAEGVRGAGAARIYGKLRQMASTTYIDTTVYSYIEQAFDTDTNIVMGRLKIETGNQSYTWKTQLPPAEAGHAFSGAMRSDPDGALEAPALLMANQTYYFHFAYQVSGLVVNPGTGSPFSRTSRHFFVELNGAAVPEPTSFASWMVGAMGLAAWRRWRRRGSVA